MFFVNKIYTLPNLCKKKNFNVQYNWMENRKNFGLPSFMEFVTRSFNDFCNVHCYVYEIFNHYLSYLSLIVIICSCDIDGGKQLILCVK